MSSDDGQLVMEAAVAGILVIGRDHRITAVSDLLLDLLGKRREELLGHTCHEVLRKSGKPCPDCECRHVFEDGETRSIVYSIEGEDGRVTTLTGDAVPLFNDRGEVSHAVQTLKNAYPDDEVADLLHHQEEDLRRASVKFASKKSRGWIDVGGSRMCLLDLEGGWLNLYTTLADYAGDETAARTLFEAGLSESFTRNAIRKDLIQPNADGFRAALDCFSEAGFGDYRIEELHFSEGAVVIVCHDGSGAWSFKRNGLRSEHPVCYYAAGVLLSFMRHTSGKTALYCVETACLARGDAECRFHIGPKSWLQKRGVEIPERGMTIKEKAELTREWMGRIMNASGARQLVGESEAMREVLEFVDTIKDSDSPVLLEGESGTGKQLVAEAIHKESIRAEEPFVPVNCAAMPGSLLESELFGHAKGSFTGAVADKPGLVEIASNGTLFIDEVCEMDLAAQVKLLNVLDTGVYRRVGETKERHAKARVVAATNRNIAEEVQKKRFREDLYYRLNVIHIRIPPLRARKEDIPLLVNHFLKFAAVPGGERKTAAAEFIRVLMAHDWPGNVRELANVIERAVIISGKEKRLTPRRLPSELVERAKLGDQPARKQKTLEEAEGEHICAVLAQQKGNKTRAAQMLGITRATLRRKLARLGLS